MKFDIVRAWKDEAYRQSLSDEQVGQLSANPAGEIELDDVELFSVYGGDNFGVGAGAFSTNGTNGGFGFNNFNNIAISRSCSHNCSFGCDIRDF